MESENKQENEGNEASNTVDLLGNVDVAPADKSSSLLSEIKHLESLVEQLEQVNADQKAQILRLQKERTRKSVIMLSPTPPPAVKEDEEEIPGNEGAVKLESFLKFFQSKTVSDSQLLLHGVNFLVSVYQMVYAKERPGRPETPSESETASKIAFNYVLEFMRQVNNLHVNAVVSSNRFVDFGYPIHWLISLFPYAEQGHTTDQLWMPLHFALAIDTSTPGFDHDSYLVHMEVLLTAYGAKAFDEDVSPLSIAVSTARPNLDAVRLILEYRPDCVRKPDEDGSLPFMHACANNVGLETIEFLYEQFPAAATATDNFGCAAIHYAAFYGTPQAVGFLLQVEPSCATLVEGNGALPLHDAVQNRRCSGTTEMVELLLQAHPGGVRQRDDYGALPLHMAAKAATLNVVQLLHRVFPKVDRSDPCLAVAQLKQALCPCMFYFALSTIKTDLLSPHVF